MLSIEMLPAEHGDALWVTWGDCRSPHHLLIDGGPVDNDVSELLRATIAERVTDVGGRLELLVITHIDADHIGGLVTLLEGPDELAIGDVWFNGYDHLPTDVLGAVQAERVTTAIGTRQLPWNAAFGGDRVAVPEDADEPLQTVELPGGLRLTVLGPTVDALRRLRPEWEEAVRAAGLVPGVDPDAPSGPGDLLGGGRVDVEELAATRFRKDRSKPNAASICLLAEHDGHSLLLAGDALAQDVIDGLERLEAQRGEEVSVDVCKLPHHGSKANVSTELVEKVAAKRWLISSSGKQFHHPDPEAIARILHASDHEVELVFNYRSEESLVWDDDRLRRKHGYTTVYPRDGITVRL